MLFDCHTHSTNSDGKNTVEEMCASSLENALDGVMITDHADMNFYNERNTYSRIQNSIRDIQEAQEKYSGSLKVFKGIELGEYTISPQKAEEVLSLNCFDAVLCSIHFVPQAGWSLAYNRIDFHTAMPSEAEINEYLKLYFDLLSETVDAFDFDVLAHIHCPARYITGKYGRKSNVMLFEDKISEILEKIVKRNIALELNTLYIKDQDGKYNFSLDKILGMYKQLGGRMVTLGSDAHNKADVGRNFQQAAQLLKEQGFDRAYYYENRKPVSYPL